MANDLLPNNLIQQTSDTSTEQAKQLISQATGMAGTYLQNLKTMAGGSADQPMRTMAREQMDLDNALKRANEYMTVSGKVPETDFLNAVGLSGTLGPVAGHDTMETQRANDDLAIKWYNATKKTGSGSTPKLSDKEEVAGSLGDAYQAIDNLLAQGTDPKEIENIIYDSEADFARKGLTVAQPLLYLQNKVSLANGGTRSTDEKDIKPITEIIEKATAEAAEAAKNKENERLKARPLWQRAIDILPGEQYR